MSEMRMRWEGGGLLGPQIYTELAAIRAAKARKLIRNPPEKTGG